MLIEFIGSTGAGKTMLFSAVQQRLAQTATVTTAFALVAAQLRLQRVTHPSLQNVIQEFAGLPFFVRALPKHRALLRFVMSMLARSASVTTTVTMTPLYILRSLVRKVGVDEIIRRNARNQAVLVDEGMMLLAHNLFVYNNVRYTADEVAKFTTLIPLPDSIIYVKAPLESLINRAMTRTDRRREMQSWNRNQLEAYMQRTVGLYEQLVEAECVRDRVVTIDNPESVNKVNHQAVDAITEFVLSRVAVPPPSVMPPSVMPPSVMPQSGLKGNAHVS